MEKQTRVEGRTVIVALQGKMYVEDAASLREELAGYVGQGYAAFVIDLRRLEYIDSAGLGVLVSANKWAAERGGEIVLRGATGVVDKLLKLTRLNKVFTMQE